MPISKVTRNYQLTIPREIREVIDIKIGDILFFSAEDKEIKISKNSSNAIDKS
ncbi:MAG: AbrB/MazE/SpoVT family DNA-binding domain-containing protein, partial [Nanoarchaeota archaeon]